LLATLAAALMAAPPAGAQPPRVPQVAPALRAAPSERAAGTASTAPAPPPTFAAAVLVDVDTGRVLFAQNAHAPLPPGSLTKTLTAMIASDWLAADAQVPVTADAFNASPDKVGMKPGQSWPLATVEHALITDSANDAAYALAIDIGGSLPGFAPIMAEAARQIGMVDDPVLEDPAGLDGKEGVAAGNRISAWDLAISGRDMMANPDLAAIAGQQTYDFEGPDQVAYHIVSRNLHFLRSYPGAIGVKTGYTNAAGFCDIEEAEHAGRRMLAVVLHSNNPDAEAASLITSGFATPASAEKADPELPPVRQPEPPPPPPAPAAAPLHLATPQVVAAEAPLRHSRTDGWIDVLGATALVAGVGIWARRWVRRRSPG
jgi:D-alanyl-D-alanine carboxypeptidase (penicillin-binding protein 5/6)